MAEEKKESANKQEATSGKESSSHKLLRMISYKVYLLLIAVLFGIVTVILGIDIWWFPIFRFEYNLAINLFTSSLFTFLGIVLLTLFVIVREEREWRIVKDEVHSMISTELALIFNQTLELVEGGTDFGIRLLEAQNSREEKNNLLKQKLTELINNDITLCKEYSVVLDNSEFNYLSGKISNLELKYSRYLPPSVVLCLVRLQTNMELLGSFRTIADLQGNKPIVQDGSLAGDLSKVGYLVAKLSKLMMTKPLVQGIMRQLNTMYLERYQLFISNE